MHVAARADALHDLLAEVAAFGEVQGAGLAGFLREVALVEVNAVARRGFEHAQGLCSAETAGHSASGVQDIPQHADGLVCAPQLEARYEIVGWPPVSWTGTPQMRVWMSQRVSEMPTGRVTPSAASNCGASGPARPSAVRVEEMSSRATSSMMMKRSKCAMSAGTWLRSVRTSR